jgi:hypothetical protein
MKVASILPPDSPKYVGWTPCIKWCGDHCEGTWRFISEGVFEFDLDSDYMIFMLRWA